MAAIIKEKTFQTMPHRLNVLSVQKCTTTEANYTSRSYLSFSWWTAVHFALNVTSGMLLGKFIMKINRKQFFHNAHLFYQWDLFFCLLHVIYYPSTPIYCYWSPEQPPRTQQTQDHMLQRQPHTQPKEDAAEERRGCSPWLGKTHRGTKNTIRTPIIAPT